MVYQEKISIMDNLRKSSLLKLLSMLLLLTAFSFAGYAQDEEDEEGPCENRYGNDEAETKKNLSMFNQYIQTREYHKAYKYYRYLLVNAPCVQKRVLFSGAVVTESVMGHLGRTDMEAYKERFKGLRDTLYMSYEKRIEYWQQEGYVKGKWANSITLYEPNKLEDALKMFDESVRMEGYSTDDKVPSWYISAAVKGLKNEIITSDSLFRLYFHLMDIIMYNKVNSVKDAAKWETTEVYVNSTMSPYLECDKLEEFFKPRVKENPADLELKKMVVQLMNKANCESREFYLKIAEEVAVAEPSAEAFISLAAGNLANGKKWKAKELYEKGVSMMEDGPDKVDALLKLMSLYYGDQEYTKAKNYASKVISIDPNNGNAYLIMAGVYAGMVTNCKDDKLEGKSMYWLAYDMAAKATGDPETKEEANKLMATFKSRFITKADAFLHNFVEPEGASFSIPCVGISTTVRYRSE